MPPRNRVLLTLVLAAVAACGGNTGPDPSPSPVDPQGFVLRAEIVQALPPDSTFTWLPVALVTADGRLIASGPVDAMFPGPLLPNLLERSMTQAGWLAIVNAARQAGLLDGKTTFSNGDPAPGSALAHLRMVVDGKAYDLTGDPAIPPCVAPGCPRGERGSQLAFAQFWLQLSDLAGWIGPELGNERAFTPSGYAILVGPPMDDQGLNPAAFTWPLGKKLAGFGAPIAAGDGRRCGVVAGADAATLQPLFQQARQNARWLDDGDSGAGYGLVVRPLLPGDGDLCAALT
jgi:hypothetical protein